MLEDKNGEFFAELVKYHISGQLKVAPEHCVDGVLDYMGKPHFDVFEKFWAKYRRINEKNQKEQYLVPYLMSSHPGSTLQDAVALAEFLHQNGRQPEQVQDFYPTPGTLSTCMYYTGIDPRTMEPVYVAKDPHEKALQRALLQWRRPELRRLVTEALYKAHREDLIGYGKNCLIRPLSSYKKAEEEKDGKKAPRSGKVTSAPAKGAAKAPAKGGKAAEKPVRGKDAKTPVKPAKGKELAPARGAKGENGRRGDNSGRKAPMSAAKKARFQKKRGK